MLNQKYKSSVIIISHNSAAIIEGCLESVLSQRTGYPFEVILVDSSADNTPSIVKDKFPQVKLIHSNVKLLPGEARNAGLANAQGGIIVFLASDCIACENWLDGRIKDHLSGFSLVSGAVENEITKNLFSWANYFIEYSGQSANRNRVLVNNRPLYALSYRVDIFQRYGTFPSGIRFGEDTVFNRKLIAAGEKILFDPRIKIYHRGAKDLRGFIRHALGHGRALRFIRKRFNVPVSNLTDNNLLIPFLILFGRGTTVLLNILRWATRSQMLYFILTIPLIIVGLSAMSIGYVRNQPSSTPGVRMG